MRLVNADLLKDAMIVACRAFESKGIDTMVARAVISIIDTVAPGEKNGRWVPETDRDRHWHCSVCGYVAGIAARTFKYCPNCGVRVEDDLEPGEDDADAD